MDSGSVEELSKKLIRALEERGLLPPEGRVDADTPLVSSGWIDSFGLVEVLETLESVAGVRIPVGRVSPQDLDSIASMIRIARRFGTRD